MDDPTVLNDTLLLRRIPTNPMCVVHDKNLNRKRPSSINFTDNDLSIVLGDTLALQGRANESALGSFTTGFALVSLTAGFVRGESQRVVRDPTPEESAHGLVLGEKSKKLSRLMAKNAIWVVPPP